MCKLSNELSLPVLTGESLTTYIQRFPEISAASALAINNRRLTACHLLHNQFGAASLTARRDVSR